jgi:uncharacterized protein (TIGR03382 family)
VDLTSGAFTLTYNMQCGQTFADCPGIRDACQTQLFMSWCDPTHYPNAPLCSDYHFPQAEYYIENVLDYDCVDGKVTPRAQSSAGAAAVGGMSGGGAGTGGSSAGAVAAAGKSGAGGAGGGNATAGTTAAGGGSGAASGKKSSGGCNASGRNDGPSGLAWLGLGVVLLVLRRRKALRFAA